MIGAAHSQRRRLGNPLHTYFHDVGSTALLTAEQEAELARLVQDGDYAAREEMVRANLRLVVKLAKENMGRGLDLEDMIAEGNLGLMHAVEYFDPAVGVRFSTYAKYWIKEAIDRCIKNTGRTIRIPSYMHQTVKNWNDTSRKLEYDLGRTPTAQEIGKAMGLSALKLKNIVEAIRIYNAAPKPQGEEVTTSLADLAVDESESGAAGLEAGEEVERVLGLIDRMTDEKAKMVLKLRFGLSGKEPMLLREVGKALGMTRERARQIESRALAALREGLGSN